jgi:drug/metabolite transporter (DMT)-like permease
MICIFSGKSLTVSRSTLFHLVITGLLLWVGGHAWVIWGAQKADSGYAALLFGATPLWAVLFEFLIHKKSLSLMSIISVVLGFMGIICLSVPGLLSNNSSGSSPDLLTFLALSLAPASWALGSVLQGDKLKEIPALVSAGYQQLFAAIGCGLLALLFSEPIPYPSTEAWIGLSYITLLGSVVAFYSFTRALQLLPSSIVMSFAYVNPVIAVILGFFWAGEQITIWTITGMAFIISGIVILLRADKNHLADSELEHGTI